MTEQTDTTPDTRPKTMTQHLATQVKRVREAQRLPITQLSDRMAELGKPIARLGLSDIEKGKRKVDVDELAALAKALGVPPLLLFLPVGAEPRTEILPGYVRDTWAAAQWFTGEAPLSTEPQYDERGVFHAFTQSSADFNAWHTGGRPLELARGHEKALMKWRMATMHAMGDLAALRDALNALSAGTATPGIGEPQVENLREIANEGVREARACEKALLDHRQAMAREGMALPEVPELQPDRRRALADFGLKAPTSWSAPVDNGWIDGSDETDGPEETGA